MMQMHTISQFRESTANVQMYSLLKKRFVKKEVVFIALFVHSQLILCSRSNFVCYEKHMIHDLV